MRWFALEPRWWAGHVLVAVALVACLWLGDWQWERSRSVTGTGQNLGYALQWPLFGAFAVLAWAQVLRLEHRRADQPVRPVAPRPPAPEPPLPDQTRTTRTMSSPRTTPSSPSSPSGTAATAADARRIGSRLRAYRALAWIAGVSLLLLCAHLVLEYGFDRDDLGFVAIPHGWLFMAYLVAVFLLGTALRWSLRRTLLVMAAGTIPLLSFVAERRVTREVRAGLG